MGFLEILLIGVALSMDACAIAMTNGMTDSKMPLKRTLFIAALFGIFQAIMPLSGYFITDVVANAFLNTFEKISAWVSFALLAFLGGKMVYDSIECFFASKKGEEDCCACCNPKLTFAALLLQAVATSIDALAVGVSLNMESHFGGGLLLGIFGSVGVIGCTTFLLSIIAVYIGKAVGNKLADKAQLLGGIVLICLGLKILIESFL